jgi:hypothetical protein
MHLGRKDDGDRQTLEMETLVGNFLYPSILYVYIIYTATSYPSKQQEPRSIIEEEALDRTTWCALAESRDK